MLVIRLQRVGKKNQPSYRIVLAEKTAPIKGKFIEILGNYNPRLKTKAVEKERVLHWLSQGAQTSPTIHNLLVDEKIIEGPKRKVWMPKRKEKAEGERAAETSPKETKSDSGETAKQETVEQPSAEESAKKELAPAEKSAEASQMETKDEGKIEVQPEIKIKEKQEGNIVE